MRLVVRAAGGIVVRDGSVLLVHRPKYDDWSFPKGKLEGDESWEDGAIREVEEETGLRCEVGRARRLDPLLRRSRAERGAVLPDDRGR